MLKLAHDSQTQSPSQITIFLFLCYDTSFSRDIHQYVCHFYVFRWRLVFGLPGSEGGNSDSLFHDDRDTSFFPPCALLEVLEVVMRKLSCHCRERRTSCEWRHIHSPVNHSNTSQSWACTGSGMTENMSCPCFECVMLPCDAIWKVVVWLAWCDIW